MRLLLCILSLSLISTILKAQDFHFSDPTRGLMLFNPAYTGFIPENAQVRFNNMARTQWGSVLESARYRTLSTSVDLKFCGEHDGDYFAVGANISLDGQGDPGLRRTDGFLTGAYVRKVGGGMNRPNVIGAGVEVGGIQYSQKGTINRTFDDQFDTPGLSGEFLSSPTAYAFDLGVGIFGSFSGNTSGIHDINAGISLKHVTQPALGFFGNQQSGVISSDSTARLNRRLNMSLGFSFLDNDNKSVSIFSAYSNQRPHNQLLVRIMYNVLGQRETNNSAKRVKGKVVALGIAARINDGAGGTGSDALIGIFQLHQKKFILSLAYDYNISNLARSTNGNGAVELAMTFFFGSSSCLYCPGL